MTDKPTREEHMDFGKFYLGLGLCIAVAAIAVPEMALVWAVIYLAWGVVNG